MPVKLELGDIAKMKKAHPCGSDRWEIVRTGMDIGIKCLGCGRRVLVLDHARAPGEKIRISGGGRCNFTNIGTSARNFLSSNPHFAKSALGRYTQHDFVALVEKHGIAYHEKTLGQLFCDDSAKDIIAMLGINYDEAARICGCPIGTIKSRLNRARAQLKAALEPPEPSDPDKARDPELRPTA